MPEPANGLSIQRHHAPRCPYCHEEVASGEEQLACNDCQAWHHLACWEEGLARCSACGSSSTGLVRKRATLPARPTRTPAWHLGGLWCVLAALFFCFDAYALPAFGRIYYETGIVRPYLTDLLFTHGWLGSLTVLFLMQLASLRPAAEENGWVFAALVGTCGLCLVGSAALFLPLIQLTERL